MRHSKRVDDRFLELRDYIRKAADICEGDGDIVWRDDVHGDGRLVFIEQEIFFSGVSLVVRGGAIFGRGGRGRRAVEAAEMGGCGGAFGFGFLGLVRFEAGEGVADEVEDGDVLEGRRI